MSIKHENIFHFLTFPSVSSYVLPGAGQNQAECTNPWTLPTASILMLHYSGCTVSVLTCLNFYGSPGPTAQVGKWGRAMASMIQAPKAAISLISSPESVLPTLKDTLAVIINHLGNMKVTNLVVGCQRKLILTNKPIKTGWFPASCQK